MNTYDATVDNSGLEEKSLSESIKKYIKEGLPASNYFKETSVKVSGQNPILSTEIFGKEVIIDFSDVEDFLRKAGLVLVFIATIVGFFIVVRK